MFADKPVEHIEKHQSLGAEKKCEKIIHKYTCIKHSLKI